MKAKLIIAAGVLVALAASFSVSAQSFTEAPVKILPTAQKGILKIMYTEPADQSVEIRFFNDIETIASDKIEGGDYPNGFSKKYDVRKVKADNFWVEISSPNLSVTYKLIDSGDGQSFKPVLERTTFNHNLVAKNH